MKKTMKKIFKMGLFTSLLIGAGVQLTSCDSKTINKNVDTFDSETQTNKGEKGDAGKDGLDGKSAYEIWLDNGHIGTEEDFLNSLRSPNTNYDEQGLVYILQDDGTYAVSMAHDGCLSSITIPSTYNGTIVSKIISFENSNFKNITIPDSVDTIGEGAFSNCKNLESIELQNKITKIAKKYFLWM